MSVAPQIFAFLTQIIQNLEKIYRLENIRANVLKSQTFAGMKIYIKALQCDVLY